MDDLVDRARAALVGVTPGPWIRDMSYWWPSKVRSLHPDHKHRWVVDVSSFPTATHTLEDARFIAAARSLLPEMADRIAALEADLARVEAKLEEAGKSLRECASELEASVEAEWPERLREKYPIYQTKFERDMEPVIRARAILARIKEAKDNG